MRNGLCPATRCGRGPSALQRTAARRFKAGSPSAANLQIDGGVIGEGDVDAHMQPILAREFITKSRATRDDGFFVIKMLPIVPSRARTDKAHQTKPFPDPPAQFRINLRHLLALIAHGGSAAQGDDEGRR